MNDIKLNLSIQEINIMIKALGQLPYSQVHELIAKIHQQATSQLNHTNGAKMENDAPITIKEN